MAVLLVPVVLCERGRVTEGHVVNSGDVGSERAITDGRVGAADGIVHERKITDGRVEGTAVVRDERLGSNGCSC